MTKSYSAGVAIFGATALDGLASNAGLLAGLESAVITCTADRHLLSGRFKANNTAPTIGVLEVWVIPIWDVGGTPTYPDVFDGTESAETVSYRNVLFQSGYLAKVFNTDAIANRVYEFSGVNLEELCGEMPQKYVVFVTHSMVQALNVTANQGGQCWYQPVNN
jgi:hypothetical protein